MKIAFITRSTLYKVPGGDTIQVLQLADHFKRSGVETSVLLTDEEIDYPQYDLFHVSNITRPSDILFHISQTKKPFVLSPILIDYSEYDRRYRKGISGLVLRIFPPGLTEYIKTVARWLTGKDVLRSKDYIWKGQRNSIREILKKVTRLLPGSEKEYQRLKELYAVENNYSVVPNGVDTSLFCPDEKITKDDKLVLCAARIEGLKNQLNLIKALNNTEYKLVLLGASAPNQKKYFDECRSIAAENIIFLDQVSQEVLTGYYKKAKVHVLPSWFETCGLSSLEAAAMGCNVVITDKGFTREYFGDDAFYCEPDDPDSILNAIKEASRSPVRKELQQKILKHYTWQHAADITLTACKNILSA
ncbi:MAG: glycosyltransferase family 4 protein [Chitinophagaceae bacterium]